MTFELKADAQEQIQEIKEERKKRKAMLEMHIAVVQESLQQTPAIIHFEKTEPYYIASSMVRNNLGKLEEKHTCYQKDGTCYNRLSPIDQYEVLDDTHLVIYEGNTATFLNYQDAQFQVIGFYHDVKKYTYLGNGNFIVDTKDGSFHNSISLTMEDGKQCCPFFSKIEVVDKEIAEDTLLGYLEFSSKDGLNKETYLCTLSYDGKRVSDFINLNTEEVVSKAYVSRGGWFTPFRLEREEILNNLVNKKVAQKKQVVEKNK